MRRQQRRDMVDQSALIDRPTRDNDKSGDGLTEVIVGHTDNCGFSDHRVRKQRVLDFTRADLEPTRLDEVGRQPAEQPQAGLAVIATDVPGTEPPVGRSRRSRRFRSVEVAVEQRVTPQLNLTESRVIRATDAQVNTRQRLPDLARSAYVSPADAAVTMRLSVSP